MDSGPFLDTTETCAPLKVVQDRGVGLVDSISWTGYSGQYWEQQLVVRLLYLRAGIKTILTDG